MRCPSSWVSDQILLQGCDLIGREECQYLQELDDIAVVALDEELIKSIGAGPLGIQPHRPRGALAVLGAIGLGQQGQGQPPHRHAELLTAQFGSRSDIAPLVGGTDLEFTV